MIKDDLYKRWHEKYPIRIMIIQCRLFALFFIFLAFLRKIYRQTVSFNYLIMK